jgi:hypothetical protein
MAVDLGFGIGGSSGKEETSSPAAGGLISFADELQKETTPIRKNLISQLFEALLGRGANIPIISQAVEQTRRAGSTALTSTTERLAQTGLTGTPFGEMIMAQTGLEGNIAATNTESQMMQSFMDLLVNFLQNQSQTIAGSYAGAIPGSTTTRSKGKETGGAVGIDL